MSVEAAAKALVERYCDPGYGGAAVVFTDSEVLGRIPRRRAVAREKEQRRLAEAVRAVVAHLQEGGTVASAGEMTRRGDFGDSIRVVQGHGPLLDAVRARFRAKDNAWADTAAGEDLLVLHFWHDPTHRTVS